MGGFVGDVLGGIGDAIGGAVDAVGGAISDIGSGVGDVLEGALHNPLTTAALLGAGFIFAPEIGAWLAADGSVAATGAEAAAADAAAGVTAADTAANIAAATAADTAAGLGEFAGVDAAVAANAAAAAAAPAATTEAVLAAAQAADPGLMAKLGLDGLSNAQIAGMVGAGLLAPTVLSALGLGGTKAKASSGTGSGTFTTPQVDIPELTQGGVNPGMLPINPAYATTNDVQSQFNWGKQPYVASAADLVARQNQLPSTTTHGWGLQQAQQPFDVNAFIAKTINPAAAAALAGAPFPASAVAPVAPVTPTQA